MPRRNLLIFIILGGFVVIFVIIWFIMRPQYDVIQGNTAAPSVNLPRSGASTVSSPSQVQIPPKVEQEVDVSITLKSIASSFAERYGSFSNQSDFKNLEDLLPVMTDEFAARTESYIKKQRQVASDSREYYGITSTTIKNQLISYNEKDSTALLHLTMQNKEARGSISSNVRIIYKDIIIALKKEGSEWKINDAQWQQ